MGLILAKVLERPLFITTYGSSTRDKFKRECEGVFAFEGTRSIGIRDDNPARGWLWCGHCLDFQGLADGFTDQCAHCGWERSHDGTGPGTVGI